MQEEFYRNFSDHILPKIKEGLVITKEYFTDLFGRYVNYLIATDIVSIIFALLFLYLCFYLATKLHRENYDNDIETTMLVAGCTVVALVILLFIIDTVFDLIQAIYVPEVRVYEELKFKINR